MYSTADIPVSHTLYHSSLVFLRLFYSKNLGPIQIWGFTIRKICLSIEEIGVDILTKSPNRQKSMFVLRPDKESSLFTHFFHSLYKKLINFSSFLNKVYQNLYWL